MLKRLIVLLLTLICLPVFANTQNELKNLIHEFNYDMTVEWDQKEQAFISERAQRFEKDLKSLQNLKPDEIRAVLQDMTNVQGGVQTVESILSMNKIETAQDVLRFLKNNRGNIYSSGASWNGEVLWTVAYYTLVVGFIVGLVLILSNVDEYVCTERATTQTCYMTEDCMTYDDGGYCVSYGSPYESCYYACLNGYYED